MHRRRRRINRQYAKLFSYLGILLCCLLLLSILHNNTTAAADDTTLSSTVSNGTTIEYTHATSSVNRNEEYNNDNDNDNDEDDAPSSSLPPYYTSEPQQALVYPWVVQILGVITFFVLQHYELPIPFAAFVFVIGMAMGIAAFRLIGAPLAPQLHNSIRIWSDIDSQLLLLVFLPGLIFRDAIDIDLYIFQKCFTQLLVLAFPMVLVGTAMTAVVVVYVLPSAYDSDIEWTWPLGLTVGSILASTDPVAVAAVLKQADAPPRLQMHIGGESMLNDGAAVVFYTIFATQFLAELGLNDTTVTVGDGILIFVRMSLGGVAVGFCFAICLLLLLYELDRRLDKENSVIQVVAAVSTAYMSYYVSEQVCQMSGVIACVTCGILTKALGGSRLLADPELMDTYLKLLEHLLNTLLFTLGGTVFGEVISNSDERAHFTATEWASLLILYVFVMIIRGFQVTLFYPALKRLGLSTNWKEMAFMSFAGLRGAVGIALALALDRTVRQETSDEGSRAVTSTVVGLAGGVSFLTLLVNGTLAEWLLQQLSLTPPKASRKQVLRLFEFSARDFILHAFEKLRKRQPRFEQVPFEMVRDHLPFLEGVDQVYLDNREDQIQSGFHRMFNRSNSQARAYEEMEEAVKQTMQSVNDAMADANTTGAAACPEGVTKGVRVIFLKLLDAGYRAELAQGGCQDDDGFTYETLRQSVVFATKNCRAAEEGPLSDWTYANSFASHHIGAERYVRRLGEWCRDNLMFWKAKEQQQRCSHAHEMLRNRVIRALVFLEAHRRAEKELHDYLDGDGLLRSEGMTSAHVENATKTVLDESQAQVRQAEDWLAAGVPAEDLYDIRGHYMMSILLHKLGLYVEKSVEDGRLKETEGRMFLSQIDTRIQKVLNCQSKHDDDKSSRRRTKQKSSASTAMSTLASFWNGPQDGGGEGSKTRTRRKKQHSAPAESIFWQDVETETGEAKGKEASDDVASNNNEPASRHHRLWSIMSNPGVPDQDEDEGDIGTNPPHQQKRKDTRLSNIASFGSLWKRPKEGEKRAKPRRTKQASAPAASGFWNIDEADDTKGGIDRSSLHRSWSMQSNVSEPPKSPTPQSDDGTNAEAAAPLSQQCPEKKEPAFSNTKTTTRSSRKKQRSAPAGSGFWTLESTS